MSRFSSHKVGLVVLAMLVGVVFAPLSYAELAFYRQNFEAMTPGQGWPPNDLSEDGWLIFGIEWDANPYPDPGSANQVAFYGPFEAADGEPGSIQALATGEGGPNQGDIALVKYSDYNNANQTIRYIQALTYQTRTIEIGDVGLWRFTYDAKIGNLEGDSSAFAYIQTVDPELFFQKQFVSNDTTTLPVVWGTYNLELLIDETMLGDILNFGFSATATNYAGSGVFYDNIRFGGAGDWDRDGVTDAIDNCIDAANADQRDTNGDNFGNACDADLNDDCGVNFGDLAQLKAAFIPRPYNPDADFNGDGNVNFGDLAFLKSSFFNGAYPGPGPSALPTDCGSPDTDGDGVIDSEDNCTLVANADQRDTNGDGYGNICDADLDDDCVVDITDAGLMAGAIGCSPGSPAWCEDADLNGDGVVDATDVAVLQAAIFTAPGPSGITDVCE